MPDIANALVYYVAFLFSTTVHEAAHAWAAKRGGDLTAYHGGQVSLDPRPHIRREPFGMVVLPLLSALLSGWPFGYASAPYDPRWALSFPKRAAAMALAGPAANLLIVALAILAIKVGTGAGLFAAPDSVNFGRVVGAAGGGTLWSGAALIVSVFFSMNLVLATLNLIPFPPLDGAAGVPLVLGAEASSRYQQMLWSQPWIGLVGMLAAWKLFGLLYQPLFLSVVNLLYEGVRYG